MKGGEKVKKILISNKVLILIILGSLIFISMSAVSAASGDKIYVSGSSGNDSWDGLTPQTAKLSIKNATKTVNTGGTVYVFEGTYSGSNNSGITIDHDMTVNGVGKDKTIISGLNSAQIFRVLSGVTLNLKNLTITNAKSAFGGGIINYGTTNIDGCKFTNCYTNYAILGGGGAICNADGSTLYVQNSDFINNNAVVSSSGGGGAIMTNGTIALQNCTFVGNSAYSGGVLFVFDGNIEIGGCSFINNTATTNGGFMEIYAVDTVTNIHYSSFTGNSATKLSSTNNIDNRLENALNVNSNWWGTNSGPRGIGGPYIASNWIYMTLDVNPDKIKSGKTSNVTVNFNHLYDGTKITDIDPVQAHIPDGTIVNFTTDIGNIDPTTNGTVNGIVTSTYNATNIGLASVNAASDSQQLSKTITVEPLSTTVQVDPVSNFPGQTVTINAHVYDENGEPVTGGIVTFTVFGNTYSTLVSDGIATLTLTIPFGTGPGSYNILTLYDGTGTIYANSETTGNVEVTKTPTVLTVDDVKGATGDTVTIQAHLKDYYGNPVVGAQVKFDINGTVIEGTTDTNGLVTVTYTIKESVGIYKSTATYNGNNTFLQSTTTGTLTVTKANANIKVPDVNGKHGEKVDLVAVLTDKNGTPINGKGIFFYINGSKIGSANTDSTGTATLSYLIDENVGKYTITASLIGDSTYQDTSGTGTLTVNPISTHLLVKDVKGKNGSHINLIAVLTDEKNNPIAKQTITFTINGKTIGTATTDSTGTATLSYLLSKSGDFTIQSYYNGNNIYSGTSSYGKLNVTPWAQLYITTINNNTSPKVGETFKITYKLGNNGPDTADNVITTFKIPEGLQFVNAVFDEGKWTFDPLTRTLTWTLNSVIVGDPSLELTLKALDDGNYIITPQTTANTTINMKTSGALTINVQTDPNNNGTNGTNNSTNLPNTGIPIYPLIIGIIMVIGGIAVKK
jgi:hypothetical protein